jgi:hypothetical protein
MVTLRPGARRARLKRRPASLTRMAAPDAATAAPGGQARGPCLRLAESSMTRTRSVGEAPEGARCQCNHVTRNPALACIGRGGGKKYINVPHTHVARQHMGGIYVQENFLFHQLYQAI